MDPVSQDTQYVHVRPLIIRFDLKEKMWKSTRALNKRDAGKFFLTQWEISKWQSE